MLAVLAALPAAVATWSAVLHCWRWGVPLLVATSALGGLLAYGLYPSRVPLVYRDALVVLPLYAAFFAAGETKWLEGLPRAVLAAMAALTLLVVMQMLNPAVVTPLTALIGAKVWLFYLPLAAVGYCWPRTREDLTRLLRLFAVVSLAPCLAGILMWLSSATFGYLRTMTFVHGSAAELATQDFAWFYLGGFFYRIPGLFQFQSQHYGFVLFALVPLYMLIRLETHTVWRRFARLASGIALLACFMSGSRAAFVFAPLLLVLMPLAGGRLHSAGKWAAVAAALFLIMLWFTGLEPGLLAGEVAGLLARYAREYAWSGFVEAFLRGGWTGLGTGMNTGAARYAVADYHPVYIENWYAKALAELGPLGLLVVVALFAAVLLCGRARLKAAGGVAREAGGAVLGFVAVMAVHSLKGWQIDLEPISFFYWLFVGIMFRLPSLVAADQPQRRQRIEPNTSSSSASIIA